MGLLRGFLEREEVDWGFVVEVDEMRGMGVCLVEGMEVALIGGCVTACL